MTQAKIHLERLVQDSQDYGSNDEHMVSRVFFDLEVDSTLHKNLYCDVKQMVGSSFETAPLEVSNPVGYKGAFNHAAFQNVIEQYYRSLVGSQGRGIRITGGGNIRMQTTHLFSPATQHLKCKFLVGRGEMPNPASARDAAKARRPTTSR